MYCDKTVLDNGITVVSEHMDSVHSVALGFWVYAGARDEAPRFYGMSHFMEHMLFKGTPSRSALDISTAFDALGAELNAFTSRECTCFYSRVIDEHLPEAFEILADMVVNASFDQDAIDLEREVVIEEIARNEDSPDEYVYDLFADAVFPTHPLGRPVLGNRTTVGGFESTDMHEYHDAHYTTGNLVVAASGNVSHEQLVELSKRYLSEMKPGKRQHRAFSAESQRARLACLQKETEQAHILVGYPAFDTNDPRRFALGILDTALGGGMSSRLFQEIREKRGLVYSVYTTTQLFEDAGVFAAYAGTRPDNVREVLDVMQQEFSAAAAKGITQEELDRARELICGNFVFSMESTRAHMTRLGRLFVLGLEARSPEQTLEDYRSVTLQQVNEVAGGLLSQEPTVAVVSPYSQGDIERMI